MLTLTPERRRALIKRMRTAAERGEPRGDAVEYLDTWTQLPKQIKAEALQAYDQRLRALNQSR